MYSCFNHAAFAFHSTATIIKHRAAGRLLNELNADISIELNLKKKKIDNYPSPHCCHTNNLLLCYFLEFIRLSSVFVVIFLFPCFYIFLFFISFFYFFIMQAFCCHFIYSTHLMVDTKNEKKENCN